jgi:phage gp29-like protein
MGMEIEFVEAKGGQGNAVFGAMADYLDKQISKAVIGQTMTTDDGSSLAQAAVHEDVKIDIKKADARQLATTINRDLIIPFTAFNFGAEVAAPVFSLPVEDPEDVKSFSEALANLVPLGFKVAQKDVRKRLGTAEPDKEDDLLTPPMSGGAAPEVTTAKAQPCPHCGEVHLARSRRETEIDALVDAGRADWQADMQPLLDQIIETASAAANFEDFLQRLDRLDPNTDALGRSLAIRAMMARGDGDIGND